jgi:four helix bundle protein
MNREEMLDRTKRFAVRTVRLVGALPPTTAGIVLGRQLMKSGTAIGSNYREALGASSKRHFITILEIAQREAEETLYWLDIIMETEMLPKQKLTAIWKECTELIAILKATIRTAKRRAK